jgi:hypothetical protein
VASGRAGKNPDIATGKMRLVDRYGAVDQDNSDVRDAARALHQRRHPTSDSASTLGWSRLTCAATMRTTIVAPFCRVQLRSTAASEIVYNDPPSPDPKAHIRRLSNRLKMSRFGPACKVLSRGKAANRQGSSKPLFRLLIMRGV